MSGEFLATQFVAGMDEAVGASVDVGIIDLGRVADHDELGTLRHTGDDSLGLEWGELLGFVEDEEAVRDGAAADIAEGLDLKESTLDELFVGFERRALPSPGILLLLNGLFFLLLSLGGVRCTGAFVSLWVKGKEHLEGIVDRLKPGMEFLVQGAGKESKGVTHGDHGTTDGHAIVIPLSGEVEPRGDGHEGLAGACLTVAGDE